MIIYTDGACSGNGLEDAVGGYGIVVLDDNEQLIETYNHRTVGTTNNREELKAILYCLIKYGKQKTTPLVYSDSAYAVNTYNTWMWGWASKGWTKSDNKEIKNLDLIQTYYNLCQQGYKIDLQKCRGHAGNKWNEMADQLAVSAKDNMKGNI